MLIRTFILFSLLAVATYILANYIQQSLYSRFVLADIQGFFAESTETGEYPAIDEEGIRAAGGWVVSIDEYGMVLDGSGLETVASFTTKDLADLVNGNYMFNGEEYSATLAAYTQDGEDRIVIAALQIGRAHV